MIPFPNFDLNLTADVLTGTWYWSCAKSIGKGSEPRHFLRRFLRKLSSLGIAMRGHDV